MIFIERCDSSLESLVIAIISLLIILPIIYFLPIGFTKKGKLLILFCAFIVFSIGIALKTVLSVWQTGLVLILLAVGASYLIGKRYGNQLFIHDENSAEFEDKVIKFEIEDDIEEEIRSQVSLEKDKVLPSEQKIVSPLTQAVDEERVEEIEPIDNQKNDDFVMENIHVENEELQDEIHKNEMDANHNFDELLKEIELELNNNNELQRTDEMIEASEETIEVEPIDIDEEDDDLLITAPSTLEEIQIDSLPVNIDEQHNEESSIEEIPLIEPSEIEVDSIEEDVILSIPVENENSIQEEQMEASQNQIEEAQELVKLEENEIITLENEQDDETKEDDPSTEIVEAVEVEDDIQDNQENQDNNQALRQQLFATMISQIKLSRNKISNSHYEKIILDHLHPQLSDHDYYTVVSLLIEHYIHTGQIEELSSLLSQNRVRFEKYPVILQEINFIVDEYCKI
ncbi:hypothetical protein ACFSFW_20945 [Fredinandcohnia salidurans]|uniref:MFS transporter n=1 Tax=Fredinandcohnia salidurans TaxID=2595041 RepID=A0ABW4MT83_9BACI|nr:hypothetical protein [Fredinandcohnia onubensis]